MHGDAHQRARLVHAARDKVRRGTVKLTASYAGPAWLGTSASPAASFIIVTRAATRTALHLSASKVSYGHEQKERTSVAVTPAYAGTVTGTVSVEVCRTTVCKITLRSGKGSYVLSAK